jgi:hypothetical protein
MTERKFTPGPWTIKTTNFITYIKADTGHKEIAVMYADSGVDKQANAHLIAASPQILALIDRAVDVLQRHAPPDGLSDHDAMSEFYGIFDGPAYRAAMAKAEGKS